MGHVLISPDLHDHPSFYKMPARGVGSYLASICWLSRNGRVDRFPRAMCKAFGATPKVTDALVAESMWIENGDSYVVPQHIPAYGGRVTQVWKFGPIGTTRPKIPAALRLAVYARDGYACLHCGSSESLTLDHVHPFSLGGSDTFDNLQTLCRSCNSRKGARI